MNYDDVSVWIIDSSALIKAKSIISIHKQWKAFKHLEQMVIEGQIALPRQVITEVSEITRPDLPGAWATGVRGLLQHTMDADYEHLAHVMKLAGKVVDVKKTREDADPWVLALARQLQETCSVVCVVTVDTVDRNRISMATACELLNLNWCSAREFLNQCGIDVLQT